MSAKSPKTLEIRDLGTIDYERAYAEQRRLHELRVADSIPDTLLLLEHPHVFTLGKRGEDADLLWPQEVRRQKSVEVVRTDRGGQVTYHGPGQLVGYIIANLYEQSRRIKWFVGELEQIFVRILKKEYGISASTLASEPGVWIGSRKITAVGIAIQQKVTLHGFAFNVDPDLGYFSGIVPCGVSDASRGVTSLAAEGCPTESISMGRVKELVVEEFLRTYGYVT